MIDIYLKIRGIRLKKNLTQEDVSKRLGMAQSNYARLERGLSQLTVDRLIEISEIFEMSPDAILNYSEEEGIFKEDAHYYYNQMMKFKADKEKLQKELLNRENDDVDQYSRNQDERKKLVKSISDLRKEILAKDLVIQDRQRTIERLEKDIEEKNKSIGHLQNANMKLLEMISKS